MNKVVAILAVIVVITLGALFFFAGFYMGNTSNIKGTSGSEITSTEDSDSKKMSMSEINSKIASKSTEVSDKVMKIISSSADNVTSSVSKVVKKMNQQHAPLMSTDSLLKEIIATHSSNDSCSVEKTEQDIQSPKKYDKNSLNGKRVVFIGYFKNTVALQIQQLLMNKGYKVHVEDSRTSFGESFIFAGPFKRSENAEKLAEWLREHDFSEAKVVNVVQASVEGALSETLDDDSSIPDNDEEEEIPEVDNAQLRGLATAAVSPQTEGLASTLATQQSALAPSSAGTPIVNPVMAPTATPGVQ